MLFQVSVGLQKGGTKSVQYVRIHSAAQGFRDDSAQDSKAEKMDPSTYKRVYI